MFNIKLENKNIKAF